MKFEQTIRVDADTSLSVKIVEPLPGSIEEGAAVVIATTRLWVKIVTALKEHSELDDNPIASTPAVVVSGTTFGLPLTVTSADSPAAVLRSIRAARAGHKSMVEALAQAGISQQTPAPQTAPQQSPVNGNQPAPQAPAPTGEIIRATRPPNKNNPQFASGQQVAWTINKIVKGAHNGGVTYALWGPLGQQYALHTIFQTTKSGEDSSDWKIVGSFIQTLGLSVDEGKIETHGNWEFVTRVAHVGEPAKEYFNAVSLRAV